MGNVVLTGGGSLFPGFADRLETELSRNFPHVSKTFKLSVSIWTCVCRSKSMLLETLSSENMADGWEEAFWRVLALSINCGSAEKNGR